jgi:uncharacterized protein YajQ (UPF0234 family)
MPSFDVVSKIDLHEVNNAVDQCDREVETRFDFKGANAKFELKENQITLTAQNTFQLQQMVSILENKMAKRKVDIRHFKFNVPEESLHQAKQIIDMCQGIEQEMAKKIIKIIKDSKLKVQASIQGDQVRISGKSRDDLQLAIAMLRRQKLEIPLQYENLRN